MSPLTLLCEANLELVRLLSEIGNFGFGNRSTYLLCQQPMGWIGSRSVSFFRPKNVDNAGTVLKHFAAVQTDYDDGSDGKQEVVPGLGIGPNGAHHLEMVQDSDQEAAARIIEQRGQDYRNRDDAGEPGGE
jgi:hypothetical protein